MKKLSAIILTLAILLTAVSLTACGTSLDFKDYTTVKFKGVEGKSTATIEFDYSAFQEDYAAANGVSDAYSAKGMDLLLRLYDFGSSLEYEVVPSEGFYNGDEVEVIFTFDEKAAKDAGLTLTNASYKMVVEGLTEEIIVDAFDPAFFDTETGVMLDYEGIAPNGYLRIYNKVSDTNPLSKVVYEADDSDDIKYGDTVTITASLPYGAEDEGYVLKEETYEYTLTDVDHYISSSDIPTDDLAAIKDAYTSLLKDADTSVVYDEKNEHHFIWHDVRVENTRLGDLYFMEKTDGTLANEALISVYADISADNKKWKWNNYIAFYTVRDLYIKADGTLNFEVNEYLSEFYANDDIAEKHLLHDYKTDYNIKVVSFE